MDDVKQIKLAIYETASANLIDKELSDDMLKFCESADINNSEDVEMLSNITQTLISVQEAANDSESDEGDEEITKESVALEIYESERAGDITSEERDILLDMLNK